MTKYWTSTLFPTADHSRARKELSANLVGVTEKQYNEKNALQQMTAPKED